MQVKLNSVLSVTPKKLSNYFCFSNGSNFIPALWKASHQCGVSHNKCFNRLWGHGMIEMGIDLKFWGLRKRSADGNLFILSKVKL